VAVEFPLVSAPGDAEAAPRGALMEWAAVLIGGIVAIALAMCAWAAHKNRWRR
jgi:hypothetical protein